MENFVTVWLYQSQWQNCWEDMVHLELLTPWMSYHHKRLVLWEIVSNARPWKLYQEYWWNERHLQPFLHHWYCYHPRHLHYCSHYGLQTKKEIFEWWRFLWLWTKAERRRCQRRVTARTTQLSMNTTHGSCSRRRKPNRPFSQATVLVVLWLLIVLSSWFPLVLWVLVVNDVRCLTSRTFSILHYGSMFPTNIHQQSTDTKYNAILS
jgi:hypothetical protein